MTRRTLILGAAGACAAGCGRRQPDATYADPTLLSLVPPDAYALSGVRVAEIRRTPLWQRYVAAQSAPTLDDFARRTGMDPRKDVDEFLTVASPAGTVILSRGKFPARSQGLVPEGLDARQSAYKGHTLTGNDQAAVTLLDPSIAAAGPPSFLRSLIDARAARQLGIAPALLERLRQLPSEVQVWALSTRGLPPLPLRGNAELLGRLAGDVRDAEITADVRQGIALRAAARFATAQEAKRMHDALRGLLGLAILNTPQEQRDLHRAYDKLQVRLAGERVHVEADFPLELLDTLRRFGA